MEILIYLPIIFFFLIAYYLWKSLPFRHLPRPNLLQYLPGGMIYPMLTDPGASSRVVLNVHKTYGNLCYLWIGPHLTVFTSIPEDVAQVFNSTDVFVRPLPFQVILKDLVPAGILSKTGAEHRNARRVLQKHFTPSVVRGFHQKILDAAEEISHSLSRQSAEKENHSAKPIDITQELATATIRVMTNVAFGFSLTSEERLRFSTLMNDVLDELITEFLMYPLRRWMEPFGVRNKFLNAKKEIGKQCALFVTERMGESLEQQKNRPVDVLDAIFAMADGDMDQVLCHTLEFALAGSHTTSTTVAWALYELCCSPRVASKLDNELNEQLGPRSSTGTITSEQVEKLSYLKKVWKETTRKHPAGPFIIRKAGQDTIMKGSGLSVPKGTQVMIAPIVQHVLEDVWKDPQEFRPERWDTGNNESDMDRLVPGVFVPFSLGPRSCPGRYLAEYEAMLLLAELLRRFEFELPCKPDQVVTRTGWTESGRYSSKNDGVFDMGIPMKVKLRV